LSTIELIHPGKRTLHIGSEEGSWSIGKFEVLLRLWKHTQRDSSCSLYNQKCMVSPIVVHAPLEMAHRHIFYSKKFYIWLRKQLDKIRGRIMVFLLGNFKYQVCRDRDVWCLIQSCHLWGEAPPIIFVHSEKKSLKS